MLDRKVHFLGGDEGRWYRILRLIRAWEIVHKFWLKGAITGRVLPFSSHQDPPFRESCRLTLFVVFGPICASHLATLCWL